MSESIYGSYDWGPQYSAGIERLTELKRKGNLPSQDYDYMCSLVATVIADNMVALAKGQEMPGISGWPRNLRHVAEDLNEYILEQIAKMARGEPDTEAAATAGEYTSPSSRIGNTQPLSADESPTEPKYRVPIEFVPAMRAMHKHSGWLSALLMACVVFSVMGIILFVGNFVPGIEGHQAPYPYVEGWSDGLLVRNPSLLRVGLCALFGLASAVGYRVATKRWPGSALLEGLETGLRYGVVAVTAVFGVALMGAALGVEWIDLLLLPGGVLMGSIGTLLVGRKWRRKLGWRSSKYEGTEVSGAAMAKFVREIRTTLQAGTQNLDSVMQEAVGKLQSSLDNAEQSINRNAKALLEELAKINNLASSGASLPANSEQIVDKLAAELKASLAKANLQGGRLDLLNSQIDHLIRLAHDVLNATLKATDVNERRVDKKIAAGHEQVGSMLSTAKAESAELMASIERQIAKQKSELALLASKQDVAVVMEAISGLNTQFEVLQQQLSAFQTEKPQSVPLVAVQGGQSAAATSRPAERSAQEKVQKTAPVTPITQVKLKPATKAAPAKKRKRWVAVLVTALFVVAEGLMVLASESPQYYVANKLNAMPYGLVCSEGAGWDCRIEKWASETFTGLLPGFLKDDLVAEGQNDFWQGWEERGGGNIGPQWFQAMADDSDISVKTLQAVWDHLPNNWSVDGWFDFVEAMEQNHAGYLAQVRSGWDASFKEKHGRLWQGLHSSDTLANGFQYIYALDAFSEGLQNWSYWTNQQFALAKRYVFMHGSRADYAAAEKMWP